MYSEDSFFTLSPLHGIGLLVLTAALSLSMLWITRALSRKRGLPWRIAIPVCGFVLFVWLSPQVYYAYYLAIFDDLPVQLVVGPVPDLIEALRYASFTGPANLSAHGQGVLFWLMLAVSLACRRV